MFGKKDRQQVLSSIDRNKGFLKFSKIPNAEKEVLTPEMLKKVYGEVSCLLKWPHPNFIRVRDAFIMDKKELGTCYEWVDGPTLETWMKESHTTDQILDVFAQIVTGFKVLHDQKIMHKNICKSHFMLKQVENSTEKIVKIIGFSKLREMAHEQSVTESKVDIYSAPETQTTGSVGEGTYSRASDIWALGVLLFEMATQGDQPFDTKDQSDFKDQAEAAKYLDNKKLPDEIKSILKQILKTLPEDRFTISQLIDLVKKHVSKYMNSPAFKSEWEESRAKMHLIDSNHKFYTVTMTDKEIKDEFETYMSDCPKE